MSVTIERIPQGPIAANTYIVTDEATNHAVIIDVGDCSLDFLQKLDGKTIDAILLTHGHFDHIGGVEQLKAATGAPILIHEQDAPCLLDDEQNLSDSNGTPLQFSVGADRLLHEGDTISFGETTFTVLHTPGHTKGGVCYIDKENRLLFSGDTLFCLTAGRTDLYGGSAEALLASLIRLSRLEGDYTVYPGHNRDTTLAYERTHNRYMRRFAK